MLKNYSYKLEKLTNSHNSNKNTKTGKYTSKGAHKKNKNESIIISLFVSKNYCDTSNLDYHSQ